MNASLNANAPKPRRRKSDLNASWLMWLGVLIFLAMYFGVPILWLVIAPTKNDGQLLSMPPLSIGEIGNYARAWDNLMAYGNRIVLLWAQNSVFYTLASVVLSVVVSVPAGYAFATAKFAGRNLLMSLTLITMILPGSAMVLPLFLEMNLFRLVDTPWAVIIPAAFYPFGVYLSYVHFATALPKDLLAAGRVDGCNEWQLFRYIGLPLARTLFALLAFLSFTANWNNYFLPFVMLNDSQLYSLPVGLQVMASSTPMLNPVFAAENSTLKRPEAALVVLLLVIPVIIIFLVAQRYVVSSTLAGATKE
jgi:multiple sugar transport system permease protein